MSPAEGALRQGEIITSVVDYQISLETLQSPEGGLRVVKRQHAYAIVLTQDCDLNWDYVAKCRIEGGIDQNVEEKAKLEIRRVPAILLCEVNAATEIHGREGMHARIWDQIKINKNDRYHFFQLIPTEADLLGEGLPELAIDFKRYFTIPTDELYWQINSGAAQRRTCLDHPYLEHLGQRFTSFLSRIALPQDYESMPEGGQ